MRWHITGRAGIGIEQPSPAYAITFVKDVEVGDPVVLGPDCRTNP